MSTPPWKRDLRGQTHTISMMELRAQPGEVLDAVYDGMVIHIKRSGRHIATLVPPDYDPTVTVIERDGTIRGPAPLTLGHPELIRGSLRAGTPAEQGAMNVNSSKTN